MISDDQCNAALLPLIELESLGSVKEEFPEKIRYALLAIVEELAEKYASYDDDDYGFSDEVAAPILEPFVRRVVLWARSKIPFEFDSE